tara:strand:+ start:200 stop:400 length:201 start_codon:yes stop_codon:yes gene_type:complete
MADFCYDCSRDKLGVNPLWNDLSGLVTKEQVEDGYYMPALCEGCGFGLADDKGRIVKRAEGYVEDV